MTRVRTRLSLLLVLWTWWVAVPATSTCGPDGYQASGSIYRICLPAPEEYNGKLVVWAHGFQDAGTPVSIPEDQLTVGETSIPAIVNALGYGFATNSFSKTGLAIKEGVADIADLVQVYSDQVGAPSRVYLTGASEGGLVTALLMEKRPDLFSAGLAACGPVGSFTYQLDYVGDARLTFDYFFPGLIPGPPFDPSPALVANWGSYYDGVVKPALLNPANRARLDQWVAVARLPYDPANYLATVERSARDVLRYAVVNYHDAVAVLGGFPFENRRRWYRGSGNDLLLNLLIPRVDRAPAVLAEIGRHYTTSGQLDRPLVTLHTTRDQQVPYLHEPLYQLKTLLSGAFPRRHLNLPIDRYGHCEFTESEALYGFFLMLYLEHAQPQD